MQTRLIVFTVYLGVANHGTTWSDIVGSRESKIKWQYRRQSFSIFHGSQRLKNWR